MRVRGGGGEGGRPAEIPREESTSTTTNLPAGRPPDQPRTRTYTHTSEWGRRWKGGPTRMD